MLVLHPPSGSGAFLLIVDLLGIFFLLLAVIDIGYVVLAGIMYLLGAGLVYRDAKMINRVVGFDVVNVGGWTLLTLILWIFAIPIYLAKRGGWLRVRPSAPVRMTNVPEPRSSQQPIERSQKTVWPQPSVIPVPKTVLRLEPEANEVTVGKEFEVKIRLAADRVISRPEFNVQTTEGLVVIQSPRLATPIAPSTEGYSDSIRLRGVNQGDCQIRVTLRGEQQGFKFEQSADARIHVSPKPPALQARMLSIPTETFLGSEFSIHLCLDNLGESVATNVELMGLEALQPQVHVIQSLPSSLQLQPKVSLETPITLLPIRSGIATAKGVVVRYRDLEGRSYLHQLPELRIQIITPQPVLKLSSFTYRNDTTLNGLIHVEYTLSNVGVGDARNVWAQAVLAAGVTIARGSVSRRIPVLKQGQLEICEFDLSIGHEMTFRPISHLEVEYFDLIDAHHTTQLSENIPDIAPLSIASAIGVEKSRREETSVLVATLDGGKARSVETGEDSTWSTQKETKPNVVALIESASAEEWLRIIEDTKTKIDLSNSLNEQQDYSQDGYRNLLVAIYDSNLNTKQLSLILTNDKFTLRAIELLRGLKEKGRVEYALSSSDVHNADEVLTILNKIQEKEIPIASRSKSQEKKGNFKPKKFVFENSKRESVVVTRKTIVHEETGRPEAVLYSSDTFGQE